MNEPTSTKQEGHGKETVTTTTTTTKTVTVQKQKRMKSKEGKSLSEMTNGGSNSGKENTAVTNISK